MKNAITLLLCLPLLGALAVACTSQAPSTETTPTPTPTSTSTTPAPAPVTPAPAPTPTPTGPPKDAGAQDADAGFQCIPAARPEELYSLSADALVLGRKVSMCEYRGKVLLVVNVASYCGNTPQYEGLQNLYKTYGSRGLVVLGFPSNQFGEQEPGSSGDIKEFCEKTYGVEFPMFEKGDVNGPATQPVYAWLKSQPGQSADIAWNFEKFLIGKNGKVIQRFADGVQPEDPEVVTAITTALAAP